MWAAEGIRDSGFKSASTCEICGLNVLGGNLNPSPKRNDSAPESVPIAVARLTHGHVRWLLGREGRSDIYLKGIYEPDPELVERYASQFGFDKRLVYSDFAEMLDTVRP
jgi:hypothetical protein